MRLLWNIRKTPSMVYFKQGIFKKDFPERVGRAEYFLPVLPYNARVWFG